MPILNAKLTFVPGLFAAMILSVSRGPGVRVQSRHS